MDAPGKEPAPSDGAPRITRHQDTVVVAFTGPISGADVPRLCDQVRGAVGSGETAVVVCDVRAIPDPDLVAVDAVARLALTVIRMGSDLQVAEGACRWRQLLGLAGLEEVIRTGAGSRLEPGRQTERREPPGGVEEEVEPDDPPL